MGFELKNLKKYLKGMSDCNAKEKELDHLFDQFIDSTNNCTSRKLNEAIQLTVEINTKSENLLNDLNNISTNAAKCTTINKFPFEIMNCLNDVSTTNHTIIFIKYIIKNSLRKILHI